MKSSLTDKFSFITELPKFLGQICRYCSISALFFILFSSIHSPKLNAICSLFRDSHSLQLVRWLNALTMVLACLIFLGLRRLFLRSFKTDISFKKALILLLLESIVYAVFVLSCIHLLHFTAPIDDAKFVLSILNDLRLGKEMGYNYLYINPQNLFLMGLYAFIQFLFGKSYLAIILAFLLLHLVTIWLLFLSLKNMQLSNTRSLVLIQLMFLATQITFHIPVAYTDILSLFFTSLCLYLFTKTFPPSIRSILFLSSIAFLGFLAKGTGIIIILALAAYLFIMNRSKQRLLAVIPLMLFLLFNRGWHQLINTSQIFPDTHYGQPNTHYLMMGTHGAKLPQQLSPDEKAHWLVGTYNSEDQHYTTRLFLDEGLSKSAISKKHLSILKQRLDDLSWREFGSALTNKISTVWGSGDLKTTFSIYLGSNRNLSVRHLLTRARTGGLLYAQMMLIQYLLYIGLLLSLLSQSCKHSPIVCLTSIFFFGYFLFLVIWEASPRYAMLLFPFGLLSMGQYVNSIQRQKTGL